MREMKEELGIDIFDVQGVAYLKPYIDAVGCFSRFFIAKYDENQEIKYSPEKVASIHFFTVDEILTMINENPLMFKPDYIVAFKKYLKQISNEEKIFSKTSINRYPGHMAKTKREIKNIK